MSEIDPVVVAKDIEQHGDWFIWSAPSPLQSRSMDWHFAHKDFTSFDRGDPRSGNEASREDCIQTIGFIEDMEREDATEEGKKRIEDQTDRVLRHYHEQCLIHDMARALKNILDLPTSGNQGFMAGVHKGAARTALDRYQELFPTHKDAEHV